MYAKLCSLILAAGLTAIAQQEVRAETFESFVLRNPNKVTPHYQIKWGDDDWKSFSVSPKHLRWHAFPLDEQGVTPPPQIRFDWIGGDGQVTERYRDLKTCPTSVPRNGKQYVFRYSRNGRHVDLYAQ